MLCSGGDAVLGNRGRGHLPQTCHQQIKRPCPVLSLNFSSGSRRKLLPCPGSQKASSFFLTHRRHHFLEDLARCGPLGVSLLGRRANILTRLRRGFGTGPAGKTGKMTNQTPPLSSWGLFIPVFPQLSFPDPS